MALVSAQATLTEPTSTAGRRTVDTGLFLRILDILIDIGCAISEAVLEKAQAGLAPLLNASAVHQRVFCTVRRMIMLALKISAPGYGEGAPRPAAKEPVRRERKERGERRERDEKPEPEETDEPDLPYDLKNKSMDELLREMCRDLGLPELDGTYAWSELTPEAIAALVVRASAALLEEAAAERATPTIPDGVFWGTKSWLAARRKAARLSHRVRDG